MMWLLSLFNPAAWGQTIAAALLAFGIGGALGYVKGYDGAVAEYKVSSLKAEVSDLRAAIDAKEKQLAADAELSEAQEKSRAELEAEIERVSHVQDNRPDVCRLKPTELRFIRRTLTGSR